MKSLGQREWMFLTQMILHLNTTKERAELQKELLQGLRVLIPYTKGISYCFWEREGKLIVDSPVAYRPDGQEFDENIYMKSDSLEYWQSFHHARYSQVIRNSDLSSEDEFRLSKLYQEIYRPQGLFYSLKVLLVYQGAVLGSVALLRSEKEEDFSERDVFILDILKDHLAYKMSQLSASNLQLGKGTDYCLTSREIQILNLLCENKQNTEICEQLFISPSTLSKHINHIYQKIGVKSRAQLFQWHSHQKKDKI